jgi:hypothetical protein
VFSKKIYDEGSSVCRRDNRKNWQRGALTWREQALSSPTAAVGYCGRTSDYVSGAKQVGKRAVGARGWERQLGELHRGRVPILRLQSSCECRRAGALRNCSNLFTPGSHQSIFASVRSGASIRCCVAICWRNRILWRVEHVQLCESD